LYYMYSTCTHNLSLLHSFPTRRSSDLLNKLNAIKPGNTKTIRAKNSFINIPPIAILRQVRGYVIIFQNLKQHSTNSINHLSLMRSEEHTSELQSRFDLVCRLLLEKKNI